MFNVLKQVKFHVANVFACDKFVQKAYYLPKNANNREIRLLFVNDESLHQMEILPDHLPVNKGTKSEHYLSVLDVTTKQLQDIQDGNLQLPNDWVLEDNLEFLPNFNHLETSKL